MPIIRPISDLETSLSEIANAVQVRGKIVPVTLLGLPSSLCASAFSA